MVSDVRIISEKGRPCTVENPWPGKPVTLLRNGVKTGTFSTNRFTFKTTAGEIIDLAPP